ncbi:MAG TPA: carbohydrate ABC transporter permease [Armatimonadota bacterium]|jgi:ABC-type glycerol-3-phosphate transport system permease component
MTTTTEPLAPPVTKARVAKRESQVGTVVRFAALVLIAILMLLPFIWQVLTSFKPLSDLEKALWPSTWLFSNYIDVFKMVPFGRYYLNSIVVSVWVTLAQVCTSALAAFAFSRLQWRGRDTVFLLYLATMMVPGVVLMIPNFWVILKLNLYNNMAGLIIPAAFSAFGTFLLRQFMMGLPRSLDEAASIDGASEWQLFTDVILPLTSPGLIVLSIFTFLGTYQSFFWPLIIIKDEALRTLPIGMLAFQSQNGQDTTHLMAASVMSIVPLVILFIAMQKHLVKGIQLGAVKG